jgi:hypothetical protein
MATIINVQVCKYADVQMITGILRSIYHLHICTSAHPHIFCYFALQIKVSSLIKTMSNTLAQYQQAMGTCKDIFIKKARDYGTSWRVLRLISVTDQLFIKAQRIRNIQELGTQKVEDQIDGEFRGIVNYGIIGLIQLGQHGNPYQDLPVDEVSRLYDEQARFVQSVMEDKNHDYGEAWRDMSQESFVDLILTKLLRIKQILRNEGKTLISEGIDANFVDIINYALFALIKIDEATPAGRL